MTTTTVPATSILKQPRPPPPPPPKDEPNTTAAAKDRHNLTIALRHAHLLQHQKDVRAQILAAIQHLLDLPATANASPSTADATRFTTLVAIFQPADLDDLVEERNADAKCGYVLCGRPPRSATLGASAVWKVGEQGMRFCSTTCTQRLYFVKTQLCSTPAWERVPGQQAPIVLHEDDRRGRDVAAAEYARNVRRVQQELALERNETGGGVGDRVKAGKVMVERVVEKRRTAFRPLNSVQGARVSSTAIEGYEPQMRKLSKTRAADEDDDVDDDDDDD
ncbi:Rtr1/RPAP2 family [Teratosphaeria destructans]|uniref:RNA polymerase II subunit B1 CTD phosphatase RPAP2 homolog n=1 Tax=Teratosphaeria destructans TaxID=418781 RepID=A0A9W7VXS9_9PEZI|nr:Rtr1/RPAP2 family [Teratosphaeria destructans]